MKFIFYLLIIAEISLSQSANFSFETSGCRDCDQYANGIVQRSSLWLSESPVMDPMKSSRILIRTGLTAPIQKLDDKVWTYPDFDVGLKMTNNLAITGKIYGFSIEKDSPQVLGAGIQYFFGEKDTLDWIMSIQRIDLKGLNDFRLSSLTIDFRKWITWEPFQLRLGVGSNFFKEKSYIYNDDISPRMEGQTNYIGIDAMMHYGPIIYGIGGIFNQNISLASVFIQKDFF